MVPARLTRDRSRQQEFGEILRKCPVGDFANLRTQRATVGTEPLDKTLLNRALLGGEYVESARVLLGGQAGSKYFDATAPWPSRATCWHHPQSRDACAFACWMLVRS